MLNVQQEYYESGNVWIKCKFLIQIIVISYCGVFKCVYSITKWSRQLNEQTFDALLFQFYFIKSGVDSFKFELKI